MKRMHLTGKSDSKKKHEFNVYEIEFHDREIRINYH